MKTKFKNPFSQLTTGEWTLWGICMVITVISYVISNGTGFVSFLASLVGVTALIFVAKGFVIGQALTVVFAVLYGIVSLTQKYYGEMITYLGMSAPIAAFSVISWLKHPYKDSSEVKVSKLSKKQKILAAALTVGVTVAFYFILKALGNASLIVSTFSVTTSFLAAYLAYLRSPYYALAYTANDVVLIILWTVSTISDISYLPMLMCFVTFMANDVYGFYNWKRMQSRQADDIEDI